MARRIRTYIDKGLYNEIKAEQKKLMKRRRRFVSFFEASRNFRKGK